MQILVEDRGPGISALDLPHIFEPFYRGSLDDASKGPGVGLGLTLVKHVAERHHGTVEVESPQGAGASFSLFLIPQKVQHEPTKRCDT